MKTRSHQTFLNLFFDEIAHLGECILMILDFYDSMEENIVPHDIITVHAKLTKTCLNDWLQKVADSKEPSSNGNASVKRWSHQKMV